MRHKMSGMRAASDIWDEMDKKYGKLTPAQSACAPLIVSDERHAMTCASIYEVIGQHNVSVTFRRSTISPTLTVEVSIDGRKAFEYGCDPSAPVAEIAHLMRDAVMRHEGQTKGTP